MKRKMVSVLLTVSMVAAMAAGCGNAKSSNTADKNDKGTSSDTAEESKSEGGKTVGVSMPTKDLQRWNQDGANMQERLEAEGYTVDLQYASNDTSTQVSQIENMIAGGVDLLVIAAIDGDSLGTVCEQAKGAGIPIISYDRLIMNTDAISYYATFDNYKVGTVQGEYIVDQLDLENTSDTFTLEITAGDPGDNNANFFYSGAMDVLQPYIDKGTLVVESGQTKFADVATATWSTEAAQSRMENILSSYYTDKDLDVCLCSNDSTALGVENALAANYSGKYPIVTGQDCDVANVKNLIAGKQSMSVFKDTRDLAAKVVEMVSAVLSGGEAPVNDKESYDNGTGIIPSYLCDPVFADSNNYEELLIDSGYYTKDELK